MELFVTAEDRFSTLVERGRARVYEVRATITGPLDRETGRMDGSVELQANLRRTCAELNGRADEDVIEAGWPTAESIAARIMATLSSSCPTLVQVKVRPVGDALWALSRRTLR